MHLSAVGSKRLKTGTAHLDYGGVVILHHETPEGDAFYTLYGHLDPEVSERLKPGDPVAQGAAFAQSGRCQSEWRMGPACAFPTGADDRRYAGRLAGRRRILMSSSLWHAVCPNPAALLNLPDEKVFYRPTDKQAILQGQARTLRRQSVSLTYDDPVMLVRGWRHHLFDEWGRPYLDAYNNVPHVGHAHPRIQAVAADQLKRMNSNTRYLHPAQTAFADKVLSKLPDHLEVCFFVNSGTEANELASAAGARADRGQGDRDARSRLSRQYQRGGGDLGLQVQQTRRGWAGRLGGTDRGRG